MKKYLKYLKLSVALLLLCSLLPTQLFAASTPTGSVQTDTLSAAWLSGSAGSRVATNLFAYGVAVSSITIQNQNASAATLGFFDSEDKKIELTSSLAVYNKTLLATSPETTFVTTFGGTLQTNINSYGVKTVKTTSSVTVPRPLLLNIPIAGSTTTTYNFDPPVFFGRGLTVTNNNATQVITFIYEPLVPN